MVKNPKCNILIADRQVNKNKRKMGVSGKRMTQVKTKTRNSIIRQKAKTLKFNDATSNESNASNENT